MVVKKTTQRLGFKTGEFVVYPAHGVGQIVSIEPVQISPPQAIVTMAVDSTAPGSQSVRSSGL